MNLQQITYLGFCALGGLTNARLSSSQVYLGKHYMHTTYWLRCY